MRKHDVRKWLHAILDLLPVILIPVFMIYSHRHDVTENVEINYKYQSNEVNSLDDIVANNIYELDAIYLSYNDDDFVLDLNILSYSCAYEIAQYFNDNNELLNVNFPTVYFSQNDYISLGIDSGEMILSLTTSSNLTSSFVYTDYDIQLDNVVFYVDTYHLDTFKVWFENYGTDLPQYTDYNVIESVDTTNSNVMDSFMNNFNNTIQSHFNMGNVFHLEEVYQWFNINIFGGNAPVVIQSIYNIVVYELVMDLLFLLYGLFMWFIDMIQKLMEKPLNSIK